MWAGVRGWAHSDAQLRGEPCEPGTLGTVANHDPAHLRDAGAEHREGAQHVHMALAGHHVPERGDRGMVALGRKLGRRLGAQVNDGHPPGRASER